jgi:hypothetical protein
LVSARNRRRDRETNEANLISFVGVAAGTPKSQAMTDPASRPPSLFRGSDRLVAMEGEGDGRETRQGHICTDAETRAFDAYDWVSGLRP